MIKIINGKIYDTRKCRKVFSIYGQDDSLTSFLLTPNTRQLIKHIQLSDDAIMAYKKYVNNKITNGEDIQIPTDEYTKECIRSYIKRERSHDDQIEKLKNLIKNNPEIHHLCIDIACEILDVETIVEYLNLEQA